MVARACKVDIRRPATLSDRSFLMLMSSRSREQCEPTRSSNYASGVGARVAGHCGRRGWIQLGTHECCRKRLFVKDDKNRKVGWREV
jgi:hypothetical protein